MWCQVIVNSGQPAAAQGRVSTDTTASGGEESVAPTSANDGGVFAPLSGRLAYGAKDGGQWDIYLYDFAAQANTQLTFGAGDEWAPAWSHDGVSYGFVAGTTEDEDVPDFSPDGRSIAYNSGPVGARQIMVAAADADPNRAVHTVATVSGDNSNPV
jgi:Tol biopolymer transport system component